MLFSVQLGESQSYFLAALQGIEFTGVFGLDFLIGLVNACFAALITQHYLKKVNPSDQWLIAGALAGFSLWLGYGMYAVPHWDTVINAQVKTSIAFIQPNEEPSASIPPAAPGFSKSYPPELAYTELLKADSPELIIIPETRYKGYFRYDHINSAFQRHVDNLNIPVIFQDNEQAYINNEPKKYNSAVLLNDNGKHSATYRKTKRVPFGEYLPLFDEWAPAKKWVVELFGDFFIDFSAGNEPTVFTAGQIKALPLICYEVMFSDFVANSVNAVPHSNVLITISNNGWFGETRQPYQHLNSSLLRSVETRLPMIHATNNGPSAVFLANGRRLLETPYHQSAAFVTQVPLATQPTPTLFTQHPYWFVYLCIAVLTTLIIFRIKIKK
ncbi:hypothetical protein NBRC116494_33340 [Aurantivibrio plasticivorans]